ncbi:thioredoxin [bacterium]|nr:MAG: thioredoxin [bacterium]
MDTGPEVSTTTNLPLLVDLGSDKCANCQKMRPILAALETEFAGRFEVKFIDVWKNADASATYGIRVIPTQIFFAADGTELFRHEGFYGREEILGKWRELGIGIGSDIGSDPGPDAG